MTRAQLTRGEQAALELLVDADRPLTSRDIANSLGLSLGPVNKRLRALVGYGEVIRYRPEGQSSYLYAHKHNRQARQRLARIAGREWNGGDGRDPT